MKRLVGGPEIGRPMHAVVEGSFPQQLSTGNTYQVRRKNYRTHQGLKNQSRNGKALVAIKWRKC
jgi:hypothetical protein